MSLDEDVLLAAARGESIDYEKWPGMLDPLLERLENIVYNAFPKPTMPIEPSLNHYQPTSQDTTSTQTISNKENTPPSDLRTQLLTQSTQSSSPTTERIPDSQSQSFTIPIPTNDEPTNDEYLPSPLQLLFNSIKSTLKAYFAERPPHTIQRLAELVRCPNEHYRTLPAYLRALDRVVSVTSSADTFPLQVQKPNGIVNGGDGYMAIDTGPGGDESMGGALLTPIPWLSSAAPVEGESEAQAPLPGQDSHPIPSAETNAEPQQEQRQQDRNALTTHQQSIETTPSSTGSTTEHQHTTESTSPPPTEPSEELPHARGPPVVGVEDMGLQNGRGVEMSLSAESAPSVSTTTAVSEDESDKNQSNPSSREGEADGEGDVVLGDVSNDKSETENKQNTTEESTEKPEPESGSPQGQQQSTTG